MDIDLAEIKKLSWRMYHTGKVSKKIIKKWRARGRKNIYGNKKFYKFKRHNCRWMPDTIFNRPMNKWREKPGWVCLKCRCWTSWLWRDELPESFNCEPYLSRTRERE
jgi:hypothetical protein